MDKYENILNDCEARMASSLKNFKESIQKIRTGRANPNMLDGIMMDYYGVDLSLIHI